MFGQMAQTWNDRYEVETQALTLRPHRSRFGSVWAHELDSGAGYVVELSDDREMKRL